MSLTIIVEQLADALGETGADPRDLADTLEILRTLDNTSKPEIVEARRLWIPYLEARLAPTNEVGE